MRKQHNNKGFTLLEVIVAFLLFGFVMEMMWFFYNSIYINNLRFNTTVGLSESAQLVSQTIKNEMRWSDAIEIEIELPDGTIHILEPDVPPTNISGTLECIRLYNPENPRLGDRRIVLEELPERDHDEGTQGIGYFDPVHSSDFFNTQIQEITVTQYEGNPNLYFHCVYERGGLKTGEVETMTSNFSESFTDKKDY